MSTAEKVFRWVVGLGNGDREPTVMRRPNAIATGPGGRIFVTDMGRPSVFVFDTATPELQVWNQATMREPFLAPSGIEALPGGDVLVADAERGAVFRLGQDGSPKGQFGEAVLQRPGGLAWDDRRSLLYVADIRAHDIKVFDGDGTYLRTLGGPGNEAGRFNAPSHLAVSREGVYVTDTFNARVQHLDPTGKPLGIIGTRGLYVGNMVRPKGVAVDGAGHVYVVESYYNRMLVFDGEGRFLMPLATDSSPLGRLYLPADVLVDNRQQVYLVDMFNGRVLIFQYLDQEDDEEPPILRP
jgi:DNA-binding beta-propeller fold protein YncE